MVAIRIDCLSINCGNLGISSSKLTNLLEHSFCHLNGLGNSVNYLFKRFEIHGNFQIYHQ